MKLHILAVLVIALSIVSAGQNTATLSTNLSFLTSNPATGNVEMKLVLVNCGQNNPRVISSWMIMSPPPPFRPDSTGHVAGTIIGNDKIDCGGTQAAPITPTLYAVSYFVNNAQVGPTKMYNVLAGTTFDPTTATPSNPGPVPAPTWDSAYLRLDGSNPGPQALNGQVPVFNGIQWVPGNSAGTGTVITSGSPEVGEGSIFSSSSAITGSGVQHACAQPGTDIGAKINNAASACTNLMCTVEICAGAFTATTPVTIPSGVHIVGAGEGATTLTWNTSGALFNGTDVSDTSLESMTIALGASAGGAVNFSGSATGGQWHTFKDLKVTGGSATSTIFNLTGNHYWQTNINFFTRVKLSAFAGVGFHLDHTIETFFTDISAFGVGGNLTGQTLVCDTMCDGTNIENFSGGNSGKNGFAIQNLHNTVLTTGNISAGSSVTTPVSNANLCTSGIGVTITDGTNFDYPTVSSVSAPDIVLSSISHGYSTGAKVYCDVPPNWIFAKQFVADNATGGDGILFDASLLGNCLGADFVNSWAGGSGINNNSVVTATANGIHISGGACLSFQGKIRANANCGVLIDAPFATSQGDYTFNSTKFNSNNYSNTAGSSGICSTVGINGLTVTGSTFNNNYEGSGHQYYGVNLANAGANITIVGNNMGGNVTAPLNNIPSSADVLANTNSYTADADSSLNGKLSATAYWLGATLAIDGSAHFFPKQILSYPTDGTIGYAMQPQTDTDGATAAYTLLKANGVTQVYALNKSGDVYAKSLNTGTIGSTKLLTTAAGFIDAAQLANGTGVAPYGSLGTGGLGTGTKALFDNGTWAVPGASYLSGSTSAITGTALTATCDSGTATVTGAVVGSPVAVSTTDGTDIGGAFNIRGSVTATNVVTVYVCGTGTPASKTYNVRVLN